MTINWTDVLLYGVPAYIAALGSAVAAVLGQINRRNLRTSNGATIAQHVEATHEVVTEGAETLNEIKDNTNGNS
jgi:hypothetical protein